MGETMDREVQAMASEVADRKRFHEAIDTTLSGLQENPYLYQRVIAQQNRKDGIIVLKKIPISIVLVLVLLFIATCVAFALTNGFGILDFARSGRDNVEIPADADRYILNEVSTIECAHATVVFREAAYDGRTFHMTYDVVPKSKQMLLCDCPLDESWYAFTHLDFQEEDLQRDHRTIADRVAEGGYSTIWNVDFDLTDPTDTEYIYEYGSMGSVLNEETGVFTSTVEIPYEALRTQRQVRLSIRLLPLTDIHDEFSYDYDRSEIAAMVYDLQAAVSGEEAILESVEPLPIPAAGIRIDQVRLMLLPQEIQYQITYAVTDEALYQQLFTGETGSPLHIRFIHTEDSSKLPTLLPEGITFNFKDVSIGTDGTHMQTGSLGRSAVYDEYTLGAFSFRELLKDAPRPLDTVTFQVHIQNPDTFTPEERVWQQESDRSKPHNQADDTFVNPTNDDLPEAEAVAIAKSAILKAHGLPADALDHSRIVTNLYVTNARPDYRRWFIQFQVLKEGSDTYVERFYSCIVDQEGNVIADPDIGEPSLEEKAAAEVASRQKELNRPTYFKRYLAYSAQNGDKHFCQWPYEQKAAYSTEMMELTRECETIERDIAMTLEYVYGVPGEGEISYDTVIAIANQAVADKYGASSGMTLLCEAFDISHKNFPGNVWKFVYRDPNDMYGTQYRIVLDGTDGRIIEEEEFMWQEFLQDRKYDLKFY